MSRERCAAGDCAMRNKRDGKTVVNVFRDDNECNNGELAANLFAI